MARIQQSIEIKVPVHAAYSQLTHFEDYPRFMEEVDTVWQLDDTHWHWTTRRANRPVEWDAEIIERETDRCIAWRNVSGPTNAGKVEVQPAGADASRVTLTIEAQPEQVPGSMAGESEAEMAQCLKMDMARLRDFIEACGSQRASDAQEGCGSPRNAPVPTASYAAGSEGFTGEEEPAAPVVSSRRKAAELRNDSAGSVASQWPSSTQSDSSLSKSSAERSQDARFSIAEEVNLDQQSDAVRHVGQMPQDTSAERIGQTPASDAVAKSMQQDQQDAKQRLKQALDRAVPPSEPDDLL